MQLPDDLLNGWKIVIVDDEEDSLEIARFILDFYGADVYTATDGLNGLNLIREIRPVFVISDLSMPRTDGWEMNRAMKKDLALRDIPVIALTAHAMVGDRERAIGAGFHNYLTKPLTANTFIQDLVKLLIDIPGLGAELLANK